MSSIPDLARQYFYGSSAYPTPDHDLDKADGIELFGAIDAAIGDATEALTVTTGSSYVRWTYADLAAVPSPSLGEVGLVLSGSSAGRWVYGSTGWSKVADLPVDTAAAARDAAAASAADAAASADVAHTAHTAADTAAARAAAYAVAAGVSKVYASKAAANADITNIAANAFVEVLVDESANGATTHYQKQSGLLVLTAQSPRPTDDITKLPYPTRSLAAAATTIATTVTVITTHGYASPGDGGGATYQYQASPAVGVEKITIAGRAYVLTEPRPTLRHFGAAPTVSSDVDITDAVTRAAAHCGSSTRVVVPAGTWYVATPSAFGSLVLDPEPGATIKAEGNPPVTMRVTRPLNWNVRAGQNFTTVVSPKWRALPSEKDLWLAPSRKPTVARASIDCSTITPTRIGVDTDDTFASFGGSFASNYMGWGAITVDGKWQCGLVPLKHGERLTWAPATDTGFGAATFAAMIRCTGGYVAVALYADGTAVYKRKVTGAAIVNTTMAYFGRTEPWNVGCRAVWSVDLTSPTTAAVALNGMLVLTGIPLPGLAMEVGPAVNLPSGTSVSLYFHGLVTSRGDTPFGRVVGVGIVGDSRSEETIWHGNWPSYMREALDGSRGLRVANVDNRAVAGETVAQQLARVQSVGWPTTDAFVVNLGTNDVQGQTNKITFDTNFRALLAGASAVSTTKVVIIPAHFLQPDGSGQPTLYAEAGAPYRVLMERAAIDYGYKVVDEALLVGPTSPTNTAIDPTVVDPTYRDEIHWTAWAARVLGHGIAHAVADAMSPSAGGATADILLPTEIWGADVTSAGPAPCGRFNSDGEWVCGGVITLATPTVSETIFTLPYCLRPKRDMHFVVYSADASKVVDVNLNSSTGVLAVAGILGTSSLTFSLDQLRWPTW